MNKNATQFKQNVLDTLQDQPGYRYECIYKNLLREFRQYFSTKFEEYIIKVYGYTEKFAKNTLQNKVLFQFQILRFTVETFDSKILRDMASHSGNSPDVLLKQLALFVGSFLMPKFINKGLMVTGTNKVVLRNSTNGKFVITNKTSSLLTQLRASGISIKDVDIFGPEFTSDLISTSESETYSVYQFSNDFFGVLKDLDINQKKIYVLDIYKLMFRFSVGKLIKYLAKPEFLCVILQYLQETQMRRIHMREVLARNQTAYYRAMENFLNLSSISNRVWNHFS